MVSTLYDQNLCHVKQYIPSFLQACDEYHVR